MIYRVVSKRQAILVWVMVAIASFVSGFAWRASQQDLSFLQLPYFFMGYTLAALLVGTSYGLIMRSLFKVVLRAFDDAKRSRAKVWLLGAFILAVSALSAFGLSVLTRVELPGDTLRFLTCLILVGAGMRCTIERIHSST
jgi:hypothetical protein